MLDFVAKIPSCEKALEGYQQDGNQVLFQTVDALLDRAVSGVL